MTGPSGQSGRTGVRSGVARTGTTGPPNATGQLGRTGRPARAGRTIRDDGRVLIPREIVSYSRRDGRLDQRRQKAWDAHHAAYLIEPARDLRNTSIDPAWRLDPAAAFGWLPGERRPLLVEIGSGTGEVLLDAARRHPDASYLGVEVYLPGVATTLIRAAREGLGNVRLLSAEALAVLRTALPAGSVTELWAFFPDPWPKMRHHKRRLIATPFLDAAARVLGPGGVLRLATDWADYAAQMAAVTRMHPAFDGGVSGRFDRPLTRFERKGLDRGRAIVDLTLVRREDAGFTERVGVKPAVAAVPLGTRCDPRPTGAVRRRRSLEVDPLER